MSLRVMLPQQARSLASGALASTSSCAFCTSSTMKGKAKARSRSSQDPLSRLIGLYHSAQSSPVMSDTQALTHYIDQKLLTKAGVQPVEMPVLIARGQKANLKAGQGALVFANQKDAYEYMDQPIVLEGGPEEDEDEPVLQGLEADFEAERRRVVDLEPASERTWKPFRYRASDKDQQRGRAVLDALAGTVGGKHAGPELVREAYEAFRGPAK